MTIEALKSETKKLSKLEKLEFMQYLAAILSEEERSFALTLEQHNTLIGRRNGVKSGQAKTISAKKVKAQLTEKYGLQS